MCVHFRIVTLPFSCSFSLPTQPLPLFLSPSLDRLLPRQCVPAWRSGSVQDNSGRMMPTAGVVAAATALTACYPAGEMAACVPLLISSALPSFPFFPPSASIQLIFSPSHVLTSHFPFHQPSLTASVALSAFSPFSSSFPLAFLSFSARLAVQSPWLRSPAIRSHSRRDE